MLAQGMQRYHLGIDPQIVTHITAGPAAAGAARPGGLFARRLPQVQRQQRRSASHALRTARAAARPAAAAAAAAEACQDSGCSKRQQPEQQQLVRCGRQASEGRSRPPCSQSAPRVTHRRPAGRRPAPGAQQPPLAATTAAAGATAASCRDRRRCRRCAPTAHCCLRQRFSLQVAVPPLAALSGAFSSPIEQPPVRVAAPGRTGTGGKSISAEQPPRSAAPAPRLRAAAPAAAASSNGNRAVRRRHRRPAG